MSARSEIGLFPSSASIVDEFDVMRRRFLQLQSNKLFSFATTKIQSDVTTMAEQQTCLSPIGFGKLRTQCFVPVVCQSIIARIAVTLQVLVFGMRTSAEFQQKMVFIYFNIKEITYLKD